MLTKDTISSRKPVIKSVMVAEWSGEIGIRVMTGSERNAFESNFDGGKTPPDFREQLLIRCLCDDAGKRLYADSEINLLLEMESPVIHRLYLVASELNGLTKSASDNAEKN